MKTFLLKLILFLFPICVTIIYIEYKLAHIPNSYNVKKELFESQLKDIEVIVSGNSQSYNGINPAFFSLKGFNIANSSQSLYYDKEIILSYLPEMKNLKLVIIPISYFSLYNELTDSESWRTAFYKRYWGIKDKTTSYFDLSSISNIQLYTWRETRELIKKGFNVNLASGIASNGYLKEEMEDFKKNISDSLGYSRVKVHESMMHDSHYATNLANLESLITALKKNNIEVALITPPVLPTYWKYCNDAVEKENFKTLKYLSEKYNIRFFDYFKDSRFTVKDFRDNDHLNFIGAEHFSRTLNNEVIKTILSSRKQPIDTTL